MPAPDKPFNEWTNAEFDEAFGPRYGRWWMNKMEDSGFRRHDQGEMTMPALPALDSKVHGTLIHNKDGKEIPADEFIVFRPHDNAVLPMLDFYRQQCLRLGAAFDQIAAIDRLSYRVEIWRKLHPERCKVADVEPGELRE